MTDLDRLDALAAAATPRPWTTEGGTRKNLNLVRTETPIRGTSVPTLVAMATNHGDNAGTQSAADAAFIIALVNAWPDLRSLVAEIKALRELLTVAGDSVRVAADDIRTALANLRGPVTRDESIVMACAQAILWELDSRAALHHKDGADNRLSHNRKAAAS